MDIFIRKLLKQQKQSEEEITPVNERTPEQEVLAQMSSLQIHLILHQLEEPYKEVFELRTFGDLSFRNIAQVFGKTESWARATYHRARLKIIERME